MIRVVSVEYAQQYHLWLVGRHWPHLACSDNFQVIVLLLQVGVLRLQLEDHVLQLLSLFPIDLRGHLVIGDEVGDNDDVVGVVTCIGLSGMRWLRWPSESFWQYAAINECSSFLREAKHSA